MKKNGLLWLMASALMLCLTYTSCDELPEEEDINKEEQKQDGDKKGLEAYLPAEYAQKTVGAWYMLTQQEENKTRVEAVFLFEDRTFVVTKVKYYSASDGRKPEYGINAAGRYLITEGDFTTGKASVVIGQGETFEVEMKEGKLYAQDEVFIKMSNSLIPKAIDILNGGGDDSQGGDDGQDGDDTTVTSIYGIWVNDLANPSDTLIFKEDGTGMMWNETVKFNYENNILVVGKEKYEVTIEGDVMTWAMIDDEGGKQPTGQVWFNPAGKYDKQLSDGRWDGFMGEDGSSHGMVCRFKGNEFDIYIIAWGEQIKGTFTHKGGVIHLSIREGYNARMGDEDNWSWEAGNLDPVTLQLSEGYNWWKMDQEVLKQRQEEMAKVTFALVSDVKAYGGVFGRTMVIEKSK